MYVKGMATGNSESHMLDLYDIDIFNSTISQIADKIQPIVKEGQERPMEGRSSTILFTEKDVL